MRSPVAPSCRSTRRWPVPAAHSVTACSKQPDNRQGKGRLRSPFFSADLHQGHQRTPFNPITGAVGCTPCTVTLARCVERTLPEIHLARCVDCTPHPVSRPGGLRPICRHPDPAVGCTPCTVTLARCVERTLPEIHLARCVDRTPHPVSRPGGLRPICRHPDTEDHDNHSLNKLTTSAPTWVVTCKP